MLLEKDPGRRFQNPSELLKAMPTITCAIDARRRITRESLQKTPSSASRVATRKPPARLAPKKISLARLPITGSDVFGRKEDIAFLDRAWANKNVNVVTIVAWAGVGKSTLVNHWLRRMAAKHYRFAELVFGWSTGFAVCFSRLWVLRRPKLRLRFAQPSAPHGSRKSVSLEKRAEAAYANTAAKKRAGQEDVDSECLFGNFLQRPAFRSTPRPRNPSSFSAELPDMYKPHVFGGNSVGVRKEHPFPIKEPEQLLYYAKYRAKSCARYFAT